MKRLYLLLFALLLAHLSFAQDDEMMRIMNLNTSTININGKNLKVGDQFPGKSPINWSSANQVMECKGLTTGRVYTFSYQQFQSKGAITTVKEYLLRLGKASTRSTNSSSPSFFSGKNKSAFSERRCALVIGNSIYSEIACLRNPAKDAGDISARLMDLGFDVMTGYDCSFAEMNTLLNSFSNQARGYDVALIFYSGHGIQEKGQNYLIPIDCPLNRREDLFYCVAGTEMVDKLQATNCSTRILILDACREIHTTWARSSNNGLASMEGYPGMVITFSTRAGQTADDGKGYNSPFAKAFLDNISRSDSFHDMMRRVANDTYKNTDEEQYPVVIGTLMTNFVFNPGATANKPASASNNTSASEKSPEKKQNSQYSSLSSKPASSGSYVVSATLVDEKGAPLKGASILEHGTNNATSTDWNGAFTINVSSSRSILDIKCEGHETVSMSAFVVPEIVISKSIKEGMEMETSSVPEQKTKPASIDSYVVSATVIDNDNGEPLFAVSVLEQGTDNGTLTDIDGYFRINVSSSNAVLVFSSIGYQSVSMSSMAVPRVIRLKSTNSRPKGNSKTSEQPVVVEKKSAPQKLPKNSLINQSLASYYSFDNKDASDESGNEMDAVVNGGVQFVDDTPSGTGYAVRLNGFKKGFINIPYNVFAGKTNYSISFWIKDFDYGMVVTAISTDAPRSDFPRIVATMGNKFRFYTCYDNWDSTERFDFDTSVILRNR